MVIILDITKITLNAFEHWRDVCKEVIQNVLTLYFQSHVKGIEIEHSRESLQDCSALKEPLALKPAEKHSAFLVEDFFGVLFKATIVLRVIKNVT